MTNQNSIRIFLTAVMLFLLTTRGLAGNGERQTVEFFPSHKLFPILTADGRAHQFSLTDVTENREWIGAIGGSIPVVQVNTPDAGIQAGIAATVFSGLLKPPGRLTVLTVDYRVDLPVDIRLSPLILRFALGHLSCHFADDAVEQYGRASIQHVNDYVSLAAAYDLSSIGGYVYAVCTYSYATQPVPDKPWHFQAGVDFLNLNVHQDVSVYGAVDLKLREEVGWGTTRSVQAGVKLFPRNDYRLRVAYTWRSGYDERGQFYLNRITRNLVSLFLDF